jgi:hypothetical protein
MGNADTDRHSNRKIKIFKNIFQIQGYSKVPPIKLMGNALQRVSQELDWNWIDICRVTKGAHIEHL